MGSVQGNRRCPLPVPTEPGDKDGDKEGAQGLCTTASSPGGDTQHPAETF